MYRCVAALGVALLARSPAIVRFFVVVLAFIASSLSAVTAAECDGVAARRFVLSVELMNYMATQAAPYLQADEDLAESANASDDKWMNIKLAIMDLQDRVADTRDKARVASASTQDCASTGVLDLPALDAASRAVFGLIEAFDGVMKAWPVDADVTSCEGVAAIRYFLGLRMLEMARPMLDAYPFDPEDSRLKDVDPAVMGEHMANVMALYQASVALDGASPAANDAINRCRAGTIALYGPEELAQLDAAAMGIVSMLSKLDLYLGTASALEPA